MNSEEENKKGFEDVITYTIAAQARFIEKIARDKEEIDLRWAKADASIAGQMNLELFTADELRDFIAELDGPTIYDQMIKEKQDDDDEEEAAASEEDRPAQEEDSDEGGTSEGSGTTGRGTRGRSKGKGRSKRT